MKMIYAAELEQLCLLPGADCPPAAHFFTSCTRVPKGRLLTEQLLQMDFKLDFTFNTAAAARAPSVRVKSLLSLAAFKHRSSLGKLGFVLFSTVVMKGKKK